MFICITLYTIIIFFTFIVIVLFWTGFSCRIIVIITLNVSCEMADIPWPICVIPHGIPSKHSKWLTIHFNVLWLIYWKRADPNWSVNLSKQRIDARSQHPATARCFRALYTISSPNYHLWKRTILYKMCNHCVLYEVSAIAPGDDLFCKSI